MALLPLPVQIVVFCLIGLVHIAQGQARGRTIAVTSLLEEPFLEVKEVNKSGKVTIEYEGYIKALLDEVFKVIKRDYRISIVDDKRFGQQYSNGTWDGLVGEVVNKKVDMVAAPLTINAKRRQSVEFSTPFMSYGPVIIMKKPKAPALTLEERLSRLFSPLSSSIWQMSGISWLVTSAIVYIICYVNPYDWRRLNKDRLATFREGESFTCLNTFWFTVSTLLWQGYTRGPRSVGARIVVGFWWFYVLVFVIMYIASMTNYLRVNPYQSEVYYNDIKTIEDLANQRTVDFGVIEDGNTEQYMSTARSPTLKKAVTMIQKMRGYVSSLSEGIQRVRAPDREFALVAESAMAKFHTSKDPCDLYMVGDFSVIGSYGFAYQMGSQLVKEVDVALLQLRENGILKELEDKWFDGSCESYFLDKRPGQKIERFQPIDLGAFSGALIILGLGIVAGGFVTLLEVFVFKYAETSDKDKDDEREPMNSSTKKGVMSADPEPITDV